MRRIRGYLTPHASMAIILLTGLAACSDSNNDDDQVDVSFSSQVAEPYHGHRMFDYDVSTQNPDLEIASIIFKATSKESGEVAYSRTLNKHKGTIGPVYFSPGEYELTITTNLNEIDADDITPARQRNNGSVPLEETTRYDLVEVTYLDDLGIWHTEIIIPSQGCDYTCMVDGGSISCDLSQATRSEELTETFNCLLLGEGDTTLDECADFFGSAEEFQSAFEVHDDEIEGHVYLSGDGTKEPIGCYEIDLLDVVSVFTKDFGYNIDALWIEAYGAGGGDYGWPNTNDDSSPGYGGFARTIQNLDSIKDLSDSTVISFFLGEKGTNYVSGLNGSGGAGGASSIIFSGSEVLLVAGGGGGAGEYNNTPTDSKEAGKGGSGASVFSSHLGDTYAVGDWGLNYDDDESTPGGGSSDCGEEACPGVNDGDSGHDGTQGPGGLGGSVGTNVPNSYWYNDGYYFSDDTYDGIIVSAALQLYPLLNIQGTGGHGDGSGIEAGGGGGGYGGGAGGTDWDNAGGGGGGSFAKRTYNDANYISDSFPIQNSGNGYAFLLMYDVLPD